MKKLDLSAVQNLALIKGGKLLSSVYLGTKVKVLWQCEKSHVWEATVNDVRHNNSWCPTCAKLSSPNIKELKTFAEVRNGKLLSTEYINNRSKLEWQCSNGHTWLAKWNNIKDNNRWCPKCAFKFKTEAIVRQTIEEFFGFKLDKKRFFYKTSNNKQTYYEFDGYNETHKIAFEYHGYQHYIYPNRWHHTKEQFLLAQQRDLEKEQYCKNNGIKLIIIPYTEDSKLKQYISKISVY